MTVKAKIDKAKKILSRKPEPFENENPVIFGLTKSQLRLPLFLLISVFYDEFLFKSIIYGPLRGIPFTLIFCLCNGLVMWFLSSSFSPKVNRVICYVLTFAYSFWCGVQYVYYYIFKTPLSLQSLLNGTKQVVGEFMEITIINIAKCLPVLILLFAPFILLAIYNKKWFVFTKIRASARLHDLVIVFCLFAVNIGTITIFGANGRKAYDENAAAQYYSDAFDIKLSQPLFGVLTGLRLDLQHLWCGSVYSSNVSGSLDESNIVSDYETESEVAAVADAEIDRSPNILDIDFSSLILNDTDAQLKEMDEYFSSVNPTCKNEYTGIYKDCNLIYMTCESFSSFAVDKELTPTLYKLANEGFKFTNFYNPVWGVSTLDGEYVNCQGLIPKSGVWSMWRSANNYLPFTLGNQFSKLENYLKPRAFHDNTYNYYNREQSHPNMGYDYYGLGNGLEVERTWPESDLEMMQKTIPELAASQENFHAYYMTVSGHMNYDFKSNYIAYKNKSLVENRTDLDEAQKAYLAANIELDRAMEYTLSELEKNGKLENTVIVMSADHYPYGLEKYDLDAFAGQELDETFGIYKSSLIIWKYGDPDVTVTQPVSSMDILPTISNMFSLEYDSRLISGRDIFSEGMPLVIFSDRSFITDKCSYNAATGEIISFTGEEISDDYIKSVRNIISNRFKYSALILDKNYYAHVLGNDD